MLLAIDVGNTQTVFGLFQGDRLSEQFRVGTDPAHTADELESALNSTGAGKPVVVLDTEDGPLHVVVAHVAYYKRIVRAGRVGFGSG